MNKPRALVALLLYTLLAASVVGAAAPDWAKPGNWAKYRFKMSISSPQLQLLTNASEIIVEGVVRLEIVSVDDTGFTVKATLEKYSIKPEEIARMVNPEDLAKTVGAETQRISFSNPPEAGSLGVYVDPSKLPEDGHVKVNVSGGSVEAVYDKSTGWLIRSHGQAEQQGARSSFEISLVDSNFIRKTSGGAAGGASSATYLAVGVAVAAAIAAAVAVVASKRRSS